MIRSRRTFLSIVAALAADLVAMALCLGGLSSSPVWAQNGNQCNSNDPGAPCFAQVTDILGGRRFLLRDDDLVVTFGQTSTSVANAVLQTANLNISKAETPSTISGDSPIPFSIPPPFATAVGRMFNLRNDVIATVAAETLGPGDPPFLVVNIRDDLGNRTQA